MNLQQFQAMNGGRTLVEPVETPHGRILISEAFLNDNPTEYPWGYYKLVWAIERDGVDMGRWLEIDAFHDSERGWDAASKHDARVKAALEDALAWIADNAETRRYDA